LAESWETGTTVGFALSLGALVYSPRVAASDVTDVLGYIRQPTSFESLPAHRIARFEPHSPLPSAGVEVGDLIVDSGSKAVVTRVTPIGHELPLIARASRA
jgi:hypothetical protein